MGDFCHGDESLAGVNVELVEFAELDWAELDIGDACDEAGERYLIWTI